MKLALEKAKEATACGEVPVGAVVVERKTSKVISATHNLSETKKSPIEHAEILALTKAAEILGTKYLSDCDLYVTLEPCPLCAASISMFRVGRLFYGAFDAKFGAVESASKFFSSPNCYHRPEVFSGICEEESAALMQDFFKKLR